MKHFRKAQIHRNNLNFFQTEIEISSAFTEWIIKGTKTFKFFFNITRKLMKQTRLP